MVALGSVVSTSGWPSGVGSKPAFRSAPEEKPRPAPVSTRAHVVGFRDARDRGQQVDADCVSHAFSASGRFSSIRAAPPRALEVHGLVRAPARSLIRRVRCPSHSCPSPAHVGSPGAHARSRPSRGVAVVAAGVAAPLVRRRLHLPTAGGARGRRRRARRPLRRCSRARARATSRRALLQMWAYLAAYEMPYDDPEALERRVRIDYPVRVDRVLGSARRRRCGSSAARHPGRVPRVREGARLVALAVVRGPARHGRLPAAAPPRALPARRRADLRHLRPRR